MTVNHSKQCLNFLTAEKWLDSIEKQKRRNLNFRSKIAQISLPWQQIKNRRTFCSFCHGELMAKNGSIRSRNKKEEAMFVIDGQRDRVNNKK